MELGTRPQGLKGRLVTADTSSELPDSHSGVYAIANPRFAKTLRKLASEAFALDFNFQMIAMPRRSDLPVQGDRHVFNAAG